MLGCTLCSTLNKYRKVNGLGYYSYIKLYQAGVYPILAYVTEVS